MKVSTEVSSGSVHFLSHPFVSWAHYDRAHLASLQHLVQLSHEAFLDGVGQEGKGEMDATIFLGFISHVSSSCKGGLLSWVQAGERSWGLKAKLQLCTSSVSPQSGMDPRHFNFRP